MRYDAVYIYLITSTDYTSCTNRTNPLFSPQGSHDDIEGTENSVKKVLTHFLTPILPNIMGEPKRESLI